MAPPRKDPEIRCRCSCCGGPVYIDEPAGCYCPDCATVFRQMEEAHGLGAGCERDAGPHVHRVWRPRGEWGKNLQQLEQTWSTEQEVSHG